MSWKIPYTACHAHDEFHGLTDPEFEEAWNFGEYLWTHSQGNLKDKHPGEGSLRIQQLGSVSERIGFKCFGFPWLPGVDTFKGPDLPGNIEVRLIGVDYYGLRVYGPQAGTKEDHDSRRVMGVIMPKGQERKPARLPGWILARDAKALNPLWIQNPNNKIPFYGVHQAFLRPLSELREILRQEGFSCPSPPIPQRA
jgi:hypothetical protein